MNPSISNVLSVLLVGFAVTVNAQIPRQIAYQGVLTDSKGNVQTDGKYAVSFSFYEVESGGTARWTEDDSVVTQQGMFSVLLGEKDSLKLAFDKQYWLGVTVCGKEMLPRVKLAAAAYALRAEKADTAEVARRISKDSSLSVASLTVNGNMGIGTSNPITKLHLRFGENQNLCISPANAIQGSVVFRAVNDNWSANIPWEFQASKYFFDGGNVGIGTISPSYRLDVNGAIKGAKYYGSNELLLDDYQTVYPSSNVYLASAGCDRDSWIFLDDCDHGTNWGMYHRQRDSEIKGLPGNSIGFIGGGSSTLQSYISLANGNAYFAGNVGIGTPSTAEKLDVNGNLKVSGAITTAYLTVTPQNTSGEGGEINLVGSGGGGDIHLDNLNGNFRIFVLATGKQVQVLGGDLVVDGSIRGSSCCSSSDRRFKTAITPLTSSLDKLSLLQGVSYDWNRTAFPSRNFSEGRQIGLIAQDVEPVIPEVVSTDKDGYKSLAYDKLVAVLIEAAKEQKVIAEKQQQKIEALESRINELEKR